MANVTHTVVKGDTLSEIAVRYGTTVKKLVELNNIKDPDVIVVGQVLTISGTSSSTSNETSTTSRATIDVFGLQSNTDRTVYATWTWSKDDTENYETKWYYDTGDDVWFVGSDSTVKDKQSTYNAPSNATRVKFKVKPVAKKSSSNGTETSPWTASWSTEKTYSFSSNPPTKPSTPSVSIENYKLTASLDNLNVNGTEIQFQIVKDDSSVFNTGKATIKTNSATYACTVNAGSKYKVRCRAVRGSLYSDWSDYSNNISTIPSSPARISQCKATSETSVYLEWPTVNTATSYDIEYTTKKKYFDGSDQTTSVTGIEFTHYEKTGLEMGEEYFFRVRAVNSVGHSVWSEITSIVIGKKPAAPTTWSSTTTVTTGDTLNLYWVHNAEDASSQTYAELEIYINDDKEVYTIRNSTDEEEKDKTSVYSVDTSEYSEGTKLHWRVRTAGITNTYGDWSIQRTVDIYAPPTLQLSVTNVNSTVLETLTSFPFYMSGLAGPNTQVPIGYHVTVTAKESYETVDNIGNTKMVSAGEQVYSKYFDTSDPLLVEFSANNIDLENNISYTVTVVVSMNSGLTAEASSEFRVAWTDDEYEPNAEIGIDDENLVAYIRPYCEDENGDLVEGVKLSVYRREFDGGFTELFTGLENTDSTFIVDPHPSLDYARYRIVATVTETGAVSYYDIPGHPIGEKAAIIQWDENWVKTFDVTSEDELEQPPWSGSMLKLPYNINVSDKYNPDVSLVEYIGREHPVSYYGTQLGSSSSWSMDIDKKDMETLYTLRRLSIYKGDVYVREPSGSGYWAHITVSFSQTHRELKIPVSLEITRVEGGI